MIQVKRVNQYIHVKIELNISICKHSFWALFTRSAMIKLITQPLMFAHSKLPLCMIMQFEKFYIYIKWYEKLGSFVKNLAATKKMILKKKIFLLKSIPTNIICIN